MERASEIAGACVEQGSSSFADEIPEAFVGSPGGGESIRLLTDRLTVGAGETVVAVPVSRDAGILTASWVEIRRIADDFFVNEDEFHTADLVSVRGVGDCYLVQTQPDWPTGEYELAIATGGGSKLSNRIWVE